MESRAHHLPLPYNNKNLERFLSGRQNCEGTWVFTPDICECYLRPEKWEQMSWGSKDLYTTQRLNITRITATEKACFT